MTKKPKQSVKTRVSKPSAAAGAAGGIAGIIPSLPPTWQPWAGAVAAGLGLLAALMKKPAP